MFRQCWVKSKLISSELNNRCTRALHFSSSRSLSWVFCLLPSCVARGKGTWLCRALSRRLWSMLSLMSQPNIHHWWCRTSIVVNQHNTLRQKQGVHCCCAIVSSLVPLYSTLPFLIAVLFSGVFSSWNHSIAEEGLKRLVYFLWFIFKK